MVALQTRQSTERQFKIQRAKLPIVTRFKVWEHAPARVLPEREQSLNTLMYWRSYGRVMREDLSAIYAFLRSQKPVVHRVQKRDRS